MLFSGVIVSLLSAGLLVSAAPTPTVDLVTRSCGNIANSAIARVDSHQPNASYLPGLSISQFYIDTPGQPGYNDGILYKENTYLEFYPPKGANTCQLETYFPAGYPIDNSSPNPGVELFRVDGPLSRSPHGIDISWTTAPTTLAGGTAPQVGYTTFESNPNQPTTKYVNSFICNQTMTFRVKLASQYTQNSAHVKFTQSNAAGFRLTYCS